MQNIKTQGLITYKFMIYQVKQVKSNKTDLTYLHDMQTKFWG